jgi:molybdopterin-binding protein
MTRIISRLRIKAMPMKLSAGNQIAGKIVKIQKGQTTAHVQIEVGAAMILTASAVIKASDVMIGK